MIIERKKNQEKEAMKDERRHTDTSEVEKILYRQKINGNKVRKGKKNKKQERLKNGGYWTYE